MKYRVRKSFVLHRPDRPPAPGGTIVDLTAAEFEQYAHQLEPYDVIPLSEPQPEPLPEPETETIVLEPPAEEPETEVEPETTAKRRRSKKDPDSN